MSFRKLLFVFPLIAAVSGLFGRHHASACLLNICDLDPMESVALEIARPVEVASGYAYVGSPPAGSSGFLSVIDPGTPASIVGWVSGPCDDVRDLAFDGDSTVAVIGRFFGGNGPDDFGYYNTVLRMDVTLPSTPAPIDTMFILSGSLTAVAFDDEGELFAGSQGGYFTAVDRDTDIMLDGGIQDILIDGSLAYAITVDPPHDTRLHVIDTDSLEVIADLALGGGGVAPKALDLGTNDVLYASGAPFGLMAFDVSDPASPSVLGQASGVGGTVGPDVAVVGNRAYVANNTYNRRLDVYDISDPTDIVYLTDLVPPAPAEGSGRYVDAAGSTAYLADWQGAGTGQDGLMIIDATECEVVTGVSGAETHRPEAPAKLRISPSVVGAGDTKITLQMEARRRPGALRVFDVAGRVRNEIGLNRESGLRWSARWAPVGEDGSRLPSGRYWVVADEAVASVFVVR